MKKVVKKVTKKKVVKKKSLGKKIEKYKVQVTIPAGTVGQIPTGKWVFWL